MTPSDENKRRYPRLATILGAELRSLERSRLAVTKDISRSGALLLSEGKFAEGDVVELAMVNAGAKQEYLLKGKVVRSKRTSNEGPLRWELAFTFEQELAADSPLLQEVVEEPKPGKNKDAK